MGRCHNIFGTYRYHTQYLLTNWNCVLEIDQDGEKIRFIKGNRTIEFYSKDIVKFEYVAGNGHFLKNDFEMYPFDAYRFYKIELSNGKRMFITCALINRIDKVLEPLIGI
jgi:hypothetical protein